MVRVPKTLSFQVLGLDPEDDIAPPRRDSKSCWTSKFATSSGVAAPLSGRMARIFGLAVTRTMPYPPLNPP